MTLTPSEITGQIVIGLAFLVLMVASGRLILRWLSRKQAIADQLRDGLYGFALFATAVARGYDHGLNKYRETMTSTAVVLECAE